MRKMEKIAPIVGLRDEFLIFPLSKADGWRVVSWLLWLIKQNCPQRRLKKFTLRKNTPHSEERKHGQNKKKS